MSRLARPIRAWRPPAERAPNTEHAAATEAAPERDLILHLAALPRRLPLLKRLSPARDQPARLEAPLTDGGRRAPRPT